MNELTKTNQNLTKKEAIGQYVHDMLDRAFSLRKMAEEARMKLEQEDCVDLCVRALGWRPLQGKENGL